MQALNKAGVVMDFSAFERLHPLASFLLLMTGWLVVVFFLLRPFTLERLNNRLPFTLCVLDFALIIALADLPKAFPHLFERLLGHSIYSVRFDNDWRWIERWDIFLSWFYLGSMIIGGLWAVVNLFRRREWILNVLAVAVTLFLLWINLNSLNPL